MEAMEEPIIMMGMTGQMFLVMNGMAPSVMWVQPRMKFTIPASWSSWEKYFLPTTTAKVVISGGTMHAAETAAMKLVPKL